MARREAQAAGADCKAISFEERIVLDVLYACQSCPIDAVSRDKIITAAFNASQVHVRLRLTRPVIDVASNLKKIANAVLDACIDCPIDDNSRVKIIATARGITPVYPPVPGNGKVIPFAPVNPGQTGPRLQVN